LFSGESNQFVLWATSFWDENLCAAFTACETSWSASHGNDCSCRRRRYRLAFCNCSCPWRPLHSDPVQHQPYRWSRRPSTTDPALCSHSAWSAEVYR
jgi:hypothetical protein